MIRISADRNGYQFPRTSPPAGVIANHQVVAFMPWVRKRTLPSPNATLMPAVCEELAKAKINIDALTISDTVDHAVVRMVVSDPRRALTIFEERGVLVVDNNVLSIENSNQRGALGKIARRLSKAKVNIEYAYLATAPGAKNGLLILRVEDVKKALKILTKK